MASQPTEPRVRVLDVETLTETRVTYRFWVGDARCDVMVIKGAEQYAMVQNLIGDGNAQHLRTLFQQMAWFLDRHELPALVNVMSGKRETSLLNVYIKRHQFVATSTSLIRKPQ